MKRDSQPAGRRPSTTVVPRWVGRLAGALLLLGLASPATLAGGGGAEASVEAQEDSGAPPRSDSAANHPPGGLVEEPSAALAESAPARAEPAAEATPPEDSPLARAAVAGRAALDAAGFERVQAEAAGRRLVLWRGGSGPHLVLLHGSGAQAGAWAAIAPGLTSRYTVHALDLPGHGDSEPAAGPLRMAEAVAGVEAYLLSLDGNATLVGNSFGAWLATIHAHRHPERVERVVLVNGGALFNMPAPGLSLTPPDRETARRTMAALRDPGSPELSDEVLDDIVRRAGSGPIGRMMMDPTGLMGHLMDGRLDEVTVPVDLLWGASDRLMTLGYARKMASQLPRARLTELAGCGHIPAGECPERFLEALSGVLALPPPEGAVGESASGEPVAQASSDLPADSHREPVGEAGDATPAAGTTPAPIDASTPPPGFPAAGDAEEKPPEPPSPPERP